MTIKDTMGKAAYSAYCDNRNWKSYDGKELPHWEEVKPEIKAGWVKAAEAVVMVAKAYIEDSLILDMLENEMRQES